eukprot:Pompholyxophrys_punicea_v1_NODE_999_length_1054_cov_2.952953.p3 type:complete len:141 gc:universal NODE_999_length_1054_cov_2.952953:349-771(+)
MENYNFSARPFFSWFCCCFAHCALVDYNYVCIRFASSCMFASCLHQFASCMFASCLHHVGVTFASCSHVCVMFACLRPVCMFASCLQHVCIMFVSFLHHVCITSCLHHVCMFASCSHHVCMFASCLHHVCMSACSDLPAV